MNSTSRASAAPWTPDAIADQQGRTALITGGNSGIGLETARVLARHGARLILAGRSQNKLDEAAAGLRGEQPDAKITTAVIDLGDLASLQQASKRLAETETIDLLFNNAGVMNIPERRTTSDGFELTFGTNHLGHFALTAGLMPALLRSPAARIVTVSAIAATWRMGRLEDLMSDRRYGAMSAYAKSKRANVVFTQELARRLTGTSIEALVVHPGSAMTNLQRHSQGPLSQLIVALTSRTVMGSAEGAAWPSLYAATSLDAHSGQFIAPAGRDQTAGSPKPVPLPRGADDPAEGAFLWTESERLTGIHFLSDPTALR
ncbi:oxidoreductase [Streptomyces sp. AK02-01A]|uniref:oxidoreductase n=1 Tax=Streptomyces sp. AK02-01A TaxID=3028648 RepID=UPI0029A476ED|nr:oxidoreductase [Streptomyces sp. AK02-01A]MDX3854950.1 oxidoreductase [Streptomyces sp. AK02-01A]